jgi:[ribosomal protein S18]-alanine N-acetyltransferase
MRVMDLFRKSPELSVLPLTLADTRHAAQIHAASFTPSWSDGEIEKLLSRDHTYGHVARAAGTKGIAGFVLYTLVAGEGEILTIATDPSWRKRGIGAKLVNAALAHLSAERAEAMFLEVGESNIGALALYRKLGFKEVARRSNYYAAVKGSAPATGSSALVMRRDLR